MKKEKEIHAGFSVTPPTAKVMATVCDRCLGNREMALNLWVENSNRKCVPNLSIKLHHRYVCIGRKHIIGLILSEVSGILGGVGMSLPQIRMCTATMAKGKVLFISLRRVLRLCH